MQTQRLLILLLSLVSAMVLANDINWHDTHELIDDHFPDVPSITTQKLADMLENKQQPVLIDAREPEEYNVSHLRDATNVASIHALNELKLDKEAPIVFYCSVGYRSSALAEKAIDKGYVNAVNLKGSIFQWANEGRAVYSGDEQVEKVHPFNTKWGRLLNREYQ